MRRGGGCVHNATHRNATSQASNTTSSRVTARRTAATADKCDIGLEGRREQVAVKGVGALCVVDRQEARSSLRFEALCFKLTGEHGGEPLSFLFSFIFSNLKF